MGKINNNLFWLGVFALIQYVSLATKLCKKNKEEFVLFGVLLVFLVLFLATTIIAQVVKLPGGLLELFLWLPIKFVFHCFSEHPKLEASDENDFVLSRTGG